MKKSISIYIVDNGARLSKIYDLAEEYAMEYLHEPELTYLARRRNKIMDDIAEMATEILLLRQKLYEAELDNIIAPLAHNTIVIQQGPENKHIDRVEVLNL